MPTQSVTRSASVGKAEVLGALWGDDGGGSSDDKITDLVLQPGGPSAGPTGLGVELALPNLYETRLDEDDDGEDEIYARVSYFDCDTRLTQTFRTGT
jgi:hypothetical protein